MRLFRSKSIVAGLALSLVGLGSAVAKMPPCAGEQDAARRTAIELAHFHFQSFWLEGDQRWYSAYTLAAETRNPLQPKSNDAEAPAGPVSGIIVARGLVCTAFDLEPGEIYVVRYTTPVWRYHEGSGWSAVRRDAARGGQVMEVLLKKMADGRFELHDNLEGRRALPEDARQRKPTEAEIAELIAATRAKRDAPSRR
jgi:hypothetical protein